STAVQYTCGSGGNVGAAGAAATGRLGTMYGGGAAGKAVTGNAPTWTKVGAIYGARV
ncbi:receptor-recognizing protein, partial [Salmonella enterica]|nr:receptor-recognizing protein [Salmonella enterica]